MLCTTFSGWGRLADNASDASADMSANMQGFSPIPNGGVRFRLLSQEDNIRQPLQRPNIASRTPKTCKEGFHSLRARAEGDWRGGTGRPEVAQEQGSGRGMGHSDGHGAGHAFLPGMQCG